MPYCYECGASSPVDAGVPTCPRHGPRWKLVRNASAADVVIIGPRGLLLSRRAIEPFRGRWETPGGMQQLGEHPADTARREVREELGLKVRVTDILGVYLDAFEDGWCQTTVFVGESDSDPTSGDDETLEWRWFAIDELPSADEMAFTHRRRLDDLVEWLRSKERRELRLG